MDLSSDEIKRILQWAASTDFESKLEDEDVPVIDKLAAEIGEDPAPYYDVLVSCR